MKEAIIDIKMNPHRPKKPASDESTTDEEEMIVYDVEDEIESNPDYVKQIDVHLLDMPPQIAVWSRNASIVHSLIPLIRNCPKWRIEKEIQTIKTNRNISYIEARKFITPQPSQTYAQVAKSITVNSSSQTDETITKIVCPPLKLLQPLITISKPNMSSSVPAVTKSSTSTQAQLVPSTSSVTVTSPSISQPPNSVIGTVSTASDNLSISTASSSSTACSVLETTTTTSNTIPTTSQDTTQTSKPRRKKRPPTNQSNTIKPKIEIKTAPHRPRKSAHTEYSTDEEYMIIYDVCVCGR
ncbi:uncharacterized protein TNCV_357861 [Trichonephila clavipes]|nr:uncharacterized protein TNCV_357861 [Trichonephila clavipes]